MEVKYGNSYLELPGNVASSAWILRLKEETSLNDPEKAVRNVLTKPDAGPGVKEIFSSGEKICIIVNDATRVAGTELILPVLIKELNRAGIKDDDVLIQFAEGLHRKTTENEMVQIVGRKIRQRFMLYNHDANNRSDLSRVGYTSRGTPVEINRRVLQADRRIIVGSINYHFFAGFGGGYKSLVPGVAGRDTIEANHSLMLQEGSRIGVLKGNPVHEDLKEAAMMVGCDFAIFTVLNEAKEMLAVYAGEIDAVHKIGCSYVEKTYGIHISSPGDVVIVSCGGYPKDINLYQAQKTLENAAQAVKEGGVIVFVAECREGMGSDKFYEYARKYNSLTQLKAKLVRHFEVGGHKAYAVARVTAKCHVLMVTALDGETVSALGFQKCASLHEAVEIAMKKVGENPMIYYMPAGSITTPILS